MVKLDLSRINFEVDQTKADLKKGSQETVKPQEKSQEVEKRSQAAVGETLTTKRGNPKGALASEGWLSKDLAFTELALRR